jgi:hypothetical protein
MHFGPFSKNELEQITAVLDKAKVQYEVVENEAAKKRNEEMLNDPIQTRKNLRFDQGIMDVVILESQKDKVPASLEKFGIHFHQEFTYEEIMNAKPSEVDNKPKYDAKKANWILRGFMIFFILVNLFFLIRNMNR